MILVLIGLLRKIVNHPRLIFKYIHKQDDKGEISEENEELILYEQKLNQEKEDKSNKSKSEPEGPVIRLNKEQLAE